MIYKIIKTIIITKKRKKLPYGISSPNLGFIFIKNKMLTILLNLDLKI